MAKTWESAQKNEKQFWDNIYLNNETDIITHQPIKIETGLEYLFKNLNRHKIGLNELNGKKIADLGCGPSGLALGLDYLMKNSSINSTTIFAIDPLMNHYEKYGLIKSNERLIFVPEKGETTGLEDNSLDMVFSLNAIDHVENPLSVIKEVRRILKPSGYFLISCHVLYSVFSPVSPIFKYVDKNHPHHFTENYLKKLLEKEFTQVNLTYSATMLEDHPDFALSRIFRSATILRGMQRVVSNYILKSVYFSCI